MQNIKSFSDTIFLKGKINRTSVPKEDRNRGQQFSYKPHAATSTYVENLLLLKLVLKKIMKPWFKDLYGQVICCFLKHAYECRYLPYQFSNPYQHSQVSWNYQSWKRPPKSPSPTICLLPLLSTSHVPKCYSHPFLNHLQGWWPWHNKAPLAAAVISYAVLDAVCTRSLAMGWGLWGV